jgi:predicted esterase
MPVVIFHGNEDEVIYYESSLKLKKMFKTGDTLITLEDKGIMELRTIANTSRQ